MKSKTKASKGGCVFCCQCGNIVVDDYSVETKSGRMCAECAAKKAEKAEAESRMGLLSEIWRKRRTTRLNKIIKPSYCGPLTVREFVAIVLSDIRGFPRGLDTALAIGDFEGNFCTDVLSVTLGGSMSDHVCVCGDPHFNQIG